MTHPHTQVDGILVQLPLPSHIDEKTVCYSVTPEKDVDGFHFHNIGRYCAGEPEGALIPATPLGVLEIIKRCNIPTYGKNVCIAGRSKNIGTFQLIVMHVSECVAKSIAYAHVHVYEIRPTLD